MKKDLLSAIRVIIDSTGNITGSNPGIVKSMLMAMLPSLAYQKVSSNKSLQTSIILKPEKQRRGELLWQ